MLAARKIKWLIAAAIAGLDIAVAVALGGALRPRLTVAFLDIGQGDAIYVETPSGHQMLVDSGAGRQVLEKVGRMMPWHDRSLDLVIATHPDSDHVGGLPAVFGKYEVANFMEPGTKSETSAYAAYQKAVGEEKSSAVLARRGHIINFGDGAYLRILFPDRQIGAKDTNTSSIIAQLVYGETEVMLTGDAPKVIEQYLVSLDGTVLASDILKAGHHGSKTSSGADFVAAVAPAYAVISAGRDNRYGHPHLETLNTLTEARAKILGTYESGTIVFTSNGTNLVLKK